MRRLFIVTVLAALTAPAAQAQDIYSRQPTWAASMVATRQKVGQTSLKDVKLQPWFASEPLPAKGVSDDPVSRDNVVPGFRGADGHRILRPDDRWRDARVTNLDNRPATIRYLYREVKAGAAGAEEILWGCDSPAVLWVNGEQVFAGEGRRPCKPAQERIKVNLRQGVNTVLIKVYTESAGGAYCFEIPGATQDREVILAGVYRKFWEDFPETDWFLQDNPQRRPGATDFDSRRDFGWYFDAGRDSAAEQEMIRRVLTELGDAGKRFAARLDALVQAKTPVDDPAWLTLYAEACAARRQVRLAPLAAAVPQIVFTKHYTLGGSHYAYTEGQSDAQAERNFVAGAALCLLKWDGAEYRTEVLVDSPKGAIRDPDVSYDGKRILFAWKKVDREDDYHLYEMDVATRSIRQLTDGLGVVDYEGAYLPDGDILFNSTRCVQTVDCWWTEVSNLYRCDKNGRLIRRLTFDQVHDNYPTVTEDGRILYTRWEYNDRGQVYTQPLLQMNPDGTNQTEFYGGNSWFPTTILHARGVPGSHKVLAIATGHHSRQTGKLILVDQGKGLQENAGVQLVAPPRETPAVKVDAYGQDGELFQYPYPLSETDCLVTYHPVGWKWPEGQYGPRFGIYYMTLDGRRERLVSDARMPCSQPVPLKTRDTGFPRPTPVDYRRSDGVCYVQDVYAGPGLAGIPRGAIKTLRVVAIEFRAAGIGSNGNGGPGGGAMISTPVATGNGAWDPKIILGDATVHEDGSAYFRVPARTPVYFQLLDAKGRMVQTMRSWTTLQPGESGSCVGCHEHKNHAPLAAVSGLAALQGGAEDLKPFYGPARGFSYRREVQPILDAKCIRCHDDRSAQDGQAPGPKKKVPPPPAAEAQAKPPAPGETKKAFSLLGIGVPDRHAKRLWAESYLVLTHSITEDPQRAGGWRGHPDHPVVNWVSAQSAPPMLPPNAAGANRSRLFEQLDKGHEAVVLTREEMDKLAAWIDLGVPFCGDYLEANIWNEAEQQKYAHFLAKRKRLEAQERETIQALIGPEPARAVTTAPETLPRPAGPR